MKLSIIPFFGALFIFFGVMMGALGSHFLVEKISSASVQSFRIATRYMLFHGLALLVFPIIPYLSELQKLRAGGCIVLGVVLFSMSILALSTKNWHGVSVGFLGPITPLGGLFLLAGWGYIVVQLWKHL